MVPPGDREPGEKISGLFWREGTAAGFAEHLIWVDLRLGGRHLADWIREDHPLVLSGLEDAVQD